jgi:hypothetical protein
MVGWVVTCVAASCYGLLDNGLEVPPLGVTQDFLKIPRVTEFDLGILAELNDLLEVLVKLCDKLFFHFELLRIYYSS